MMQAIGLLTRNRKLVGNVYTQDSMPIHAAQTTNMTLCGYIANEEFWLFQEKPEQDIPIFVSCARCARKLELKPEEEK
jgi:hypothetical protein